MSAGARGAAGALITLALGVSVCAMVPARAAAPDPDERMQMLEQKLDRTLQAVEALSQRVRELEAQLQKGAQGTASAAATPGPVQPAGTADSGGDAAQRIQALESEVAQIAGSASRPQADSGMPMHGFADVGAGSHNPAYPQYRGFDIAELDFFLNPTLGGRTRALFELNFEAGEAGGVDVDLERAQLGYQVSDAATVWLGRFHTPFGYYNTAFHHGQQIATSLRRPRFLEFEDHGGVFPAHTVGTWVTGGERIGTAKLTYDVYVGNSQRISDGEIDMNNPGNTTGNLIGGGNIGVLAGGALDGLKLGISAFMTRIAIEDTAPERFSRVANVGVYGVYDTDRWEVLGEYYVFRNRNLTTDGATLSSHAGFLQLGYRADRFIPYARYERAVLDQHDDYFAAQRFGSSYSREALGLRFDMDLKSCLKIELASTRLSDRMREQFNDALLQYAIRF